jgi:hypothetical protein
MADVALAFVLWIAASAAASPSAEEILSGQAPPAEYGQHSRCLVSARIERTEVLSDRFILFHVVRDELWLAQLKRRCVGLTPHSDLVFERRGGDRICEFDAVRTVAGSVGPGGLTGPPGANPDLGLRCTLPQFELVTPQQIELLQREIRAAQKRPPKTVPQ